MTEELVLAIDQGTSAGKVVLFDLDGRVVASDEYDTPLRHPRPTWIESDAESWWTSAARGVRRILDRTAITPGRVRAVGVCGFMHSLVPIDDDGRPLGSPLLWPDQRCAAEVRELASQTRVFERAGGRPPTTMSSVPRLLWLRRNQPEVVARARAFLLPKDFLRFRLTGQLATDTRDAAGTGLTDHSTGDWSDALLTLAGVPRPAFPPILRADEVAGAITVDAAVATGLAAGTPVVVGTGDWFATIVGSGCALPDRICLYLGTAGIAGAFTSAEERARLGATEYFGSVTSTGSALRWVRELFDDPRNAGSLTYAEICSEAETSEPGARGLVFLPHLLGERGGHARPFARGTLHGLTLAHRRADVFRAVLEGTAFWLRAVTQPRLGQVPNADYLLFGGGARAPLWRRIVAATYGRRLLVPDVLDGGALGVAKLAAVGTSHAVSYDKLAQDWTRVAQVESPDPALINRYAALYARFQDLEADLARVEDRSVGE